MKLLLNLVALMFLPFLITGQSLILEVVASSGGHYDLQGEQDLHFTIGEIMTEEFKNENSLSQGFHQDFDFATAVFQNKIDSPEILLFPNPVADYLNIEFDADLKLILTIRDLYGRVLFKKQVEQGRDKIDISDYPAANYLVSIYDDNGSIQVFKLQKIKH